MLWLVTVESSKIGKCVFSVVITKQNDCYMKISPLNAQPSKCMQAGEVRNFMNAMYNCAACVLCLSGAQSLYKCANLQATLC